MSGKCPFHNKPAGEEQSTDAVSSTTAPSSDEQQNQPKKCPYASSSSSASSSSATKSWNNATSDELKEHFIKAYNQVADCAKNKSPHNYQVAKILGEQLGYSEEELAVIGDDVWMMQGTGNPHHRAEIKAGEFVVDLGSGFGLDAFVAASKVGPTGRVVGIDLAAKEVLSALERCSKRGLRNVDFRIGDIEAPPLESGVVDVCLSNGGFCLVPDKFKAFSEIFRILKPGGRFAISCTVRTKILDETKKWPSCFVAFASIEKILPWLHDIGFVKCEIDRSNADVDIWELSEHHENAAVKEEQEEVAADEKKKTKNDEENEQNKAVASSEVDKKTGVREGSGYEHLKDMVMSEYFQRVTIIAVKP